MASITKHAYTELDDITDGLERCKILPTDFVIKCGKREWKVHKFVLVMRSEYFEATCTKFQEATQGFIDLKEVDPACVEMLVSYLYTGDYNKSHSKELDFHVKMCIMADHFNIHPLFMKAIAYFQEVADAAVLLHEEAAFCKAIETTYGAMPVTDEIRKYILQLMVENDIVGDIIDKKKSTIEKTIKKTDGLALDLLKAQRASIHTPKPDEKRYQCPNSQCKEEFVANMDLLGGTAVRCFACPHSAPISEWQKCVVEKKEEKNENFVDWDAVMRKTHSMSRLKK